MHRSIVTVTLNPSIDVTLWLDGIDPDKANRVLGESREAGGKGINVSRVVRSFGLDSLCLAVAGEDNSREFASFLEQDRLRYELLRVEGAVRENLTLRCDGQTIKLNRKGPALSDMMVGALMALIQSHVRAGDIVVFAGSLPEYMAVQDYVELILAVKNSGVLVAISCGWRITASSSRGSSSPISMRSSISFPSRAPRSPMWRLPPRCCMRRGWKTP